MTTNPRALALLTLPALAACIVYDENCPDGRDDRGLGDGQDDGLEDSGALEPDDQDGGQDGDQDPSGHGMRLDPASGFPGEELISSLTADSTFDWAQVEQLRFYGPVRPCAFQARPEELLITLVVEEEAEAGQVDLLLELSDGGAVWLEDAFTVLALPEEPTEAAEESPCG